MCTGCVAGWSSARPPPRSGALPLATTPREQAVVDYVAAELDMPHDLLAMTPQAQQPQAPEEEGCGLRRAEEGEVTRVHSSGGASDELRLASYRIAPLQVLVNHLPRLVVVLRGGAVVGGLF